VLALAAIKREHGPRSYRGRLPAFDAFPGNKENRATEIVKSPGDSRCSQGVACLSSRSRILKSRVAHGNRSLLCQSIGNRAGIEQDRQSPAHLPRRVYDRQTAPKKSSPKSTSSTKHNNRHRRNRPFVLTFQGQFTRFANYGSPMLRRRCPQVTGCPGRHRQPVPCGTQPADDRSAPSVRERHGGRQGHAYGPPGPSSNATGARRGGCIRVARCVRKGLALSAAGITAPIVLLERRVRWQSTCWNIATSVLTW